jgi:hypothetical protein
MFTKDNLIHCYTRRQAIADGVLVDVTTTAKEAGFKIPVAVTASVWQECIRVPAGVSDQDEAGRLRDVLWMLYIAIWTSRSASGSHLRFSLRVRNDDREGDPPQVELDAVCGPDDDGKPCVTVMQLGED